MLVHSGGRFFQHQDGFVSHEHQVEVSASGNCCQQLLSLPSTAPLLDAQDNKAEQVCNLSSSPPKDTCIKGILCPAPSLDTHRSDANFVSRYAQCRSAMAPAVLFC